MKEDFANHSLCYKEHLKQPAWEPQFTPRLRQEEQGPFQTRAEQAVQGRSAPGSTCLGSLGFEQRVWHLFFRILFIDLRERGRKRA